MLVARDNFSIGTKEYWEYQVLTAASIKMSVFWIVAPCILVEVFRRFKGACCLHHQGDHRSDVRGSKHL
jgi:hypothetical protein